MGRILIVGLNGEAVCLHTVKKGKKKKAAATQENILFVGSIVLLQAADCRQTQTEHY